MDLIIVESPHKAKTIVFYLQKKYEVLASLGHIFDLPQKKLGIDLERHFIPEWELIAGKEKVLKEIEKKLKNAQTLYLASDPDREGEAIAYHLKEWAIQKKPNLIVKRLKFNEITKNTILEALENPSDIEEGKVESQFTRRIIDRLMGFYLSPFLWKTLKNYKLSAGRVQSVVLRFICEREEEIEQFQSKTFYELKALFEKEGEILEANLIGFEDQKPPFENKELLEELRKKLKKEFEIKDLQKKIEKHFPKPPFTTSELQKEAFSFYRFSSTKTMQIAQRLYEGVKLEKGFSGLITYMRTDSVRVSESALFQNRKFIQDTMPEYLSEKPKFFANQKNKKVQDAHEAIRPVNVFITPQQVEPYLSKEEYLLYSLIWRRFVATQMKEAIYEEEKITLHNQNTVWEIKRKKRLFDGFEKIYPSSYQEKNFPALSLNEVLIAKEIKINKKETTPPPRYTEATLIEKMEKTGIGRPSTYAPTIRLLLDRNYVTKEKNSLKPTLVGKMVNEILIKNFPEMIDPVFTSHMEDQLDKIETYDSSRLLTLKTFYQKLTSEIEKAKKTMEEQKQDYHTRLKEGLEKTRIYKAEPCPVCGKKLVRRKSKFGYFWGCEAYPQCKHTENIPKTKKKTKTKKQSSEA